MADTATATRPDTDTATLERTASATALTWLAGEFPAWDIEMDMTSGWNGIRRDLWVANQSGHHSQAALSAAKLHTRLSEYEDRERQRRKFAAR